MRAVANRTGDASIQVTCMSCERDIAHNVRKVVTFSTQREWTGHRIERRIRCEIGD